jgi:hypothetical protein
MSPHVCLTNKLRTSADYCVTTVLLMMQGIYDAVASPDDPVLSKGYTPNVFNYRSGAVDKKYPFVANADGAVMIAPYRTGVSTAQAQLYRDTLFVSVSAVNINLTSRYNLIVAFCLPVAHYYAKCSVSLCTALTYESLCTYI